MARPKKQIASTRPHVVAFRLNAAERARLQHEAAAVGVAPNDLARSKVTGTEVSVTFAKDRGDAPAETRAMYELRQQLSRVGVNLNQIARRLHMTGEHEPAELRDACRDLDELLRALLGGRFWS